MLSCSGRCTLQGSKCDKLKAAIVGNLETFIDVKYLLGIEF